MHLDWSTSILALVVIFEAHVLALVHKRGKVEDVHEYFEQVVGVAVLVEQLQCNAKTLLPQCAHILGVRYLHQDCHCMQELRRSDLVELREAVLDAELNHVDQLDHQVVIGLAYQVRCKAIKDTFHLRVSIISHVSEVLTPLLRLHFPNELEIGRVKLS